jgi:hypothetical protein
MANETEPEIERVHSGGKPPIEISADELSKLARLHCTVSEAASFFKCSKRTLQRRLLEPDLKAAWQEGRKFGMLSLRRLQWRHASGTGNGAVQMTIHLSKHWLGETEKVLSEITGKDGGPVEISNVRDRLREKLRRTQSSETGSDDSEPERP